MRMKEEVMPKLHGALTYLEMEIEYGDRDSPRRGLLFEFKLKLEELIEEVREL